MENLEEIKKQISELQSKVAKIENESKEEKKGKRWRAKVNDTYFYVDDSGDVVTCHEYNDDGDNYRYKTALEDVVRLSKENTKLKSENIRLKDVNANLKNVNANLNIEKGRLQGNLDYKNQRLKEYEKQLDLDYVDNNYILKSKLETEIKACEEALKHCNKKVDTDRIKTLNERIMLCKELLGG